MEDKKCETCELKEEAWEKLAREGVGPFWIYGHCKLRNAEVKVEPKGNINHKDCECKPLVECYPHKDREARESHPKDYGLKYDQGKLRLDLIPPEIIEGLGQVFTLGAEKYGIGNWEKGFEPGQLLAAARRHDLALAKGEFIDPDSGLPHGFHAAWNYAVLTTLELRKEK